MPKIHFIPCFIVFNALIVFSDDPTCRPGDKTCSLESEKDTSNQKPILLENADSQKKYILLPDEYENSSSPGVEFQLFQENVLDFSELGALKVHGSETQVKMGMWAVRNDPSTPWIILQDVLGNTPDEKSPFMGEHSSVRLQNIRSPGLAQLTLYSTKTPETVILYKFIMPLSLSARLKVKVETTKIFSTINNFDSSTVQYITVRDIFNVTLGTVAPEIIQEANRSFSSLPSSEILDKKISDFLYSTQTPKDFNPGIYLKPKANYGLIATLEFHIMDGSNGNATNILYDQGDVYLHGNDQLRFVPKLLQLQSFSTSPGDLEFYARCWDGTSAKESSLGPMNELKINFDSLTGKGTCDGEFNSSAKINECGYCVLGKTGKSPDYGKDTCGVCNGSNACMGCDGKPNSGMVLNSCGMCKSPQDKEFEKACTVRIIDSYPKVANIVNGTLLINVSGYSPSMIIDCWLTFQSPFANVDSNVLPSVIPFKSTLSVSNVSNNEDTANFILHWDYVNATGQFKLFCVTAGMVPVEITVNASVLYLVDYNILQLAMVEPSTIYLDDSPENMTVKITGIFIPSLTVDPSCIGVEKGTNQTSTFPAEIRNSQAAYCNLSSVTKSKLIDLHVVQHPDLSTGILSRQRSVNVTVKAKAPKLLSAKFSDSALEIIFKFDCDIIANGTCHQLFDAATLYRLGNESTCRYNTDELIVTLSTDHRMNSGDHVIFQGNIVHRASEQYFDYLPVDSTITVNGPDNNSDNELALHILGLDPPVRCGSNRHLRASAVLSTCNSSRALTSDLTFHWEVYKGNNSVVEDGNDWTFVWQTDGFEPGEEAVVKVTAVSDHVHGRNLTAAAVHRVFIQSSPLWIQLRASTRTQGVDEKLTLDASSSYDPNKRIQSLVHSWSCTRLNATDESICYGRNSSSAFEQLFDISQSVITVPVGTFAPGLYNFTDTVRSGDLEDWDSTLVSLVPEMVPVIDLLGLTVKKPSHDQPITIRARVYAVENVTVSLIFMEGQDFGSLKLPDELRNLSTVEVPASSIGPAGYMFSFTLPPGQTEEYPNWTGLAPSSVYTAKIVATTASGLTGESLITFYTNDPPMQGNLTITTTPSNSTLYALTTLVHFQASGFNDHEEDLPLSYEFGLRTYLVNETHNDQWFPVMVDVEETDLYLASASPSSPSCDRVGYQALVKVCDVFGACTSTVTPDQPFPVGRPENMTSVVEEFTREIDTDLAHGNDFGACSKVARFIEESCANLSVKGEAVSQTAAAHILSRIGPASDKDELIDAVRIANQLLLRPNAVLTDEVMEKLKGSIKLMEEHFGLNGRAEQKRRRMKRENNPSAKVSIDSKAATQLLGAYEIVVTHSKDADSVPVFLKDTQELLTQMCLGRDASQAPMRVSSIGLSAPLCVIESKGLFIDSSTSHQNITTTSLDQWNSAQLQLGSGLRQAYTLWPCDGGRSTCTTVCLASAIYFISTESSPTPMAEYLSRNYTQPLSHVHTVQLVDPISMEILLIKRPNWERYVLLVPVIRPSSTGFYVCHVITPNDQERSPNACDIIGVKRTPDGSIYISCQCHTFGHVAVFESQPPPLPVIPPHLSVKVSLAVENFDPAHFWNATLDELAILMNTSVRRIVDPEISNSDDDDHAERRRVITFVLRPPSRFDWTDSSQLLTRINDSFGSGDKVWADGGPEWRIVPQSFTYSTMKPDLKNDLNGRMITLKALNDYEDTVTKSGIEKLQATLATQLATAIGISKSRITDVTFKQGSIMITFTIQSLGPKSPEITSETAAWTLLDQIRYDELVLIDVQGNILRLDINATTVQDVDKNSAQSTNDLLPIIIGGTVGSAFLIAIIVVVVLVVIKNRGRTDKVSAITTPNSGSPNESQRNSAQSSVSVRRISITDDRNRSSLRSRRHH